MADVESRGCAGALVTVDPDRPDLPGITLHEEIGRGAHSVVYRATRQGRTFAVKLQRVVEASPETAQRFKREGALLACLHHPALPAVLELGEVHGRPYLVLDYLEGTTLAEALEDGPLSEERLVALARQLTSALAEVHRAGLVHCDIKPSNILVDREDAVHLIDFGFAVRARHSTNPDHVAGTLLYAPPEQTGMIRRPLDERSDLYALGVVLYECAAGAPPFQSGDAAELARQHAVDTPTLLSDVRPDLDPVLAAIIARLLAKDPDDRYPTARRLGRDLERLDALREAQQAGRGLTLARDREWVSPAEGPLRGRKAELHWLLRHLDRTTRGRGAVVLVEGPRGIGKSRLVHELQRTAQSRGGWVLHAQATADERRPFATLRDAVEPLWDRVAARMDAGPLDGKQLRSLVQDAGPVLGRVLPGLIPGEPDLASEALALDEPIYEVVAVFLRRLAEAAGFGLLVIEDAHRMEDGSRQVLARLAAAPRRCPLLVVATATGGPDTEAEVQAFDNEMGAGLRGRLRLDPLSDRDVTLLVAEQLGDPGAPPEFAARIAARAGGNPLAAREYVRGLIDAGLLVPSWGGWRLDEAGLEQLDLPTDVVTLVLRRLVRLSETTRGVLQAAAVIGPRFELSLLAEVWDGEQDAVPTALEEARGGRVVEAHGREHQFVLEALRSALLEDLGETAQRRWHQRIGEVLWARQDEGSEPLYAMAHHLGRAQDRAHPERVFEASLRAGCRALAECAYEAAYAFLIQAEQHATLAERALDAEFHETLGEVCAQSGRLAEAISQFEMCLEQVDAPLSRAHLRARLAHAHIANFHTQPAWQQVEAGLRELGVRVPRTRPGRLLSALWHWLLGRLADRPSAWRRCRSRHPDRDRMIVRLYEQAALVGYFGNRPLLMANMVMRAMRLAARLGPTPELVMAYNQHAVGYAAAGLGSLAVRTSERAERLARRIGDRLSLARSRLYRGFVLHLSGDVLGAERVMAHTLEEHGGVLDSMHYVDGSGDLVFNLVLRGYFREAWTWVERQLPRLTFTSGGVRSRQGNPWAGPVLMALGRTTEAVTQEAQTAAFVEGAPRTEPFLWGELLSYRLWFHLEQGEHGPALDEIIEQHRRLAMSPRWTSFHLRSFFLFQAYVRMEQAQQADLEELEPALNRLVAASQELHAAALVPTLLAHALVIDAARYRLEGRTSRAYASLQRASAIAREVDSPWVLYEVAVQRAHLLRDEGLRAASQREAQGALSLAMEHRWVHRVRRLRAAFDLGETRTRSVSASPSSSPHDASQGHSLKLRRQLEALLQVSLAAGAELDPARVAQRALDETVGILGAERAFLFLRDSNGDGLRFQAGRGGSGHDLEAPTGYSTTVVETVDRTGEPLVVSGTEDGAVAGAESVVTHGLRSIVAAPLAVRDRILGVLYLDSRLARGVFTDEDVDILRALGNHIAVALETSRAAQLEIRVGAEAQKRALAERLRDTSHALSATLQLEEVLGRLVDGLTGVIPFDRASVYLHEDDQLRRVLARQGAARPDAELAAGVEAEAEVGFPVSADPVLAEVVERRFPVFVRDTSRDARLTPFAGVPLLPSLLAVPLISQDRVSGLLVLEAAAARIYGDHEAEIAATFAGQAGIAAENARLFEEVQRLARIDPLTGTLNRRHLFDLAARELSRAVRYERPLSVVMLDVDFFKKVNDTWGHAAGDEVLRVVCARCRASLRDVDLLGRYGGEEFVVILPDTELGPATTVAERLRERIGEAPVPTAHGPIPVTVSLGVATRDPADADIGSLLDRADGALYRAKEGGRNRVETEP